MRHSFVAILCCFHGSPILGTGRGVAPEEPAAVNLHGGVCEGGARRAAMADLNGHATGNGGHSQGTPTAHRALLYSDISEYPNKSGTRRAVRCKLIIQTELILFD